MLVPVGVLLLCATVKPSIHLRALQDALLRALPHPAKPLRHTAGTIAATLIATSSMDAWPELAAALVQYLQSQDVHSLDGALNTVFKVSGRGILQQHRLLQQWCAQHRMDHMCCLCCACVAAAMVLEQHWTATAAARLNCSNRLVIDTRPPVPCTSWQQQCMPATTDAACQHVGVTYARVLTP